MMTLVRFENVPEGKTSQEFGPFEFVQLTYEGLRISPDGEGIANFIEGFWMLEDTLANLTSDELSQRWSDVIIYSKNQSEENE